jgi:hypothetical protein
MDEKLSKTDKARATVLWNLFLTGNLKDEFISPEQLETLRTKTFPEWPKDLQDKLKTFGAELIQPDTAMTDHRPDTTSSIAPVTSSNPPSAPPTTSAKGWQNPAFSPEEMRILRTVPRNQLEPELRKKAEEHGLTDRPDHKPAL